MRHLIFACLLLALPSLPASGQTVGGGEAPRYTERTLSATPMDAAIRQRFWAPGLNDGYVPQGLTYVRGTLFVGTYRSTEQQTNRGPAKVFAVDPKSGAVIGGFSLPDSIGHADGLAATPDGGLLFVSDSASRALYAFDLPRSLQAGAAVIVGKPRKLEKDPALGSAFLSFDGRWLWFGRYSRDDSAARLIAADPATLFASDKPFRVTEAMRSLTLPFHIQGATFDARGQLWLSASNGSMGKLYRIDTQTGAVLAEHTAMAGLEDLARGEDGLLWAVGEAGSQRWNSWKTFFPLLFSFDPEKLR